MSDPSKVTAASASSPRPLRSDAARNHRAVLAAARELYAQGGLGVGFDEIAQRAGVGVGTVYRRFPDRQALLTALFDDRFVAVNALAQRALDSDDAWLGLEGFIVGSVEMFSEDRGLREMAFDPANRYENLDGHRSRLAALLGKVTDRAHRAKVLRADCSPQDLASIIAVLSQLAERRAGGAEWTQGTAARCTTFMLDGIRSPA